MTVTREQLFAQRAFEVVSKRVKIGKDLKEYKSFVRSFPALIQSCGLAQALAFAMSKGGSKDEGNQRAHSDEVEDLIATLGVQTGSLDFHKKVRECDLKEYMRISREAMDAAGWVKRYADGLIENGE